MNSCSNIFNICLKYSKFIVLYARNFSWKRIWISEAPQPTRFSALALVPPFRAAYRAISKREEGSLIQFSVARWQRARGRPGIIRLKFQRYLRRSIFSAPTHGLSGHRVAYDGANIRRLTRKSLVPVHRLSFSLTISQTKNRPYRTNFNNHRMRE